METLALVENRVWLKPSQLQIMQIYIFKNLVWQKLSWSTLGNQISKSHIKYQTYQENTIGASNPYINLQNAPAEAWSYMQIHALSLWKLKNFMMQQLSKAIVFCTDLRFCQTWYHWKYKFIIFQWYQIFHILSLIRSLQFLKKSVAKLESMLNWAHKAHAFSLCPSPINMPFFPSNWVEKEEARNGATPSLKANLQSLLSPWFIVV